MISNFSKLPPLVLKQVSQFLEQYEVIVLTHVSQHYKNIIISDDFWNVYEVNWRLSTHLLLYCRWLKHYAEELKLKSLVVSINVQSAEFGEIFQGIKPTFPELESLKLDIQSHDLEINLELLKGVLTATRSLKKLATNIFSQDSELNQNLKGLEALEITDQSFVVNQKHIEGFPLVKTLLLRPYQVNFTALASYIAKNKNIQQLRLDCEECQPELFQKIFQNINEMTIKTLKLQHLQNMSSQNLSLIQPFKRLNYFRLRKTFQVTSIAWFDLFRLSAYPHLSSLNLTEAVSLEDKSLCCLIQKSTGLKYVNLSWCNKITNESIIFLIDKCQLLEQLIVVGIKELSDCAFEQFMKLKNRFNQKQFLSYQSQFRSKNQVHPQFDIQNFFTSPVQNPKCLKKLKLLDCQSVNFVSDEVLKIIGVLRSNSKIINYYGNRMGVHEREEDEDYD